MTGGRGGGAAVAARVGAEGREPHGPGHWPVVTTASPDRSLPAPAQTLPTLLHGASALPDFRLEL